MQFARRTPFAAVMASLLLLGACASSPDGQQARSYCPTGEERVCRKDVSRTQSTGARLGSKKVCRCEVVSTDDTQDAM